MIGFKYRNSNLLPAVQRHCYEAYVGCGGYNYNVTKHNFQPTVQQMKIM